MPARRSGGVSATLREPVQIAACAKRAAYTRQYDRANLGIATSLSERGRKGLVHLGRERVTRGRVVEGQHLHRAVAARKDRFIHGVSSGPMR
jgi:hypothetical protein